MPSEFKLSRNHYIVLLIIFTEVLGFTLAIPVIPFLALSLGLNPFEIGLIVSSFSLAQLISSPIIGKLSDQYGRKPLLIISQISTTIGFMILGFANTVFLLVLARLVDGLFGSNMTLAQSILSDITPNSERTKVFGYSSAVFGAGLIFGPAIGGILADISFGLPMFLAAGISFVSVILIIVVLPETKPRTIEGFSLRATDILPIIELKEFRKNNVVLVSLGMLSFYNFAFHLFISNMPLYFEMSIDAGPRDVGLLLGWVGILRVVMQSSIIAPLISFFGENKLLLSGIISLLSTMIILVFIPNFVLAMIPMTLMAYGSGVSRPILTSKLVNSVPQDQSGTVLGVNNSLVSFIQIITPTLGGFILEFSTASLLVITSATLFTVLLSFWFKNRSKVIQPVLY